MSTLAALAATRKDPSLVLHQLHTSLDDQRTQKKRIQRYDKLPTSDTEDTENKPKKARSHSDWSWIHDKVEFKASEYKMMFVTGGVFSLTKIFDRSR